MNIFDPSNCEGCQQRKEALKTMLSDHKFWMGVVVGAVGVYVYHMYKGKTG